MWLQALSVPIQKQFQICHPIILCIIWVSFNSVYIYSIAHFKPVEMCLSFSLPDACQKVMSLHDTYPRLSDGDSCDMTMKYSLPSACGNHYILSASSDIWWVISVFFLSCPSHLRVHAFARFVTVARSFSVQGASRRRQQRR